MKTNILISTVAFCCLLFEGSAKASLTDIMQKYCVPKTAGNCSNAFTAKYNASRNTCECENSYYMKYNATDRNCVIQCPLGSVPIPVSSCPLGSYQMQIVNHS